MYAVSNVTASRKGPIKLSNLLANFKAKQRLISLFWAPNGLNELREVLLEFPFIYIGKLTMAFLTGQSWGVYPNHTQVGALNKDFGAVSKTDSTRDTFRLWHMLGTTRRQFFLPV